MDALSGWEPFGALWFAVPKKRTTSGRKRMRTADRTPKRITNYYICDKCGMPKLMHKFCDNIEMCAADHRRKKPAAGKQT
ncbi:unnamed protein product [Choristocarpus tenellus]